MLSLGPVASLDSEFLEAEAIFYSSVFPVSRVWRWPSKILLWGDTSRVLGKKSRENVRHCQPGGLFNLKVSMTGKAFEQGFQRPVEVGASRFGPV